MRKLHRRPTVPGHILAELFLKPRNITVSSIAEQLNISRKHMSDIVNGRVRITPYIAVRLADLLDTSSTLWLNLQNSVDIYDAEQEYRGASANISSQLDESIASSEEIQGEKNLVSNTERDEGVGEHQDEKAKPSWARGTTPRPVENRLRPRGVGARRSGESRTKGPAGRTWLPPPSPVKREGVRASSARLEAGSTGTLFGKIWVNETLCELLESPDEKRRVYVVGELPEQAKFIILSGERWPLRKTEGSKHEFEIVGATQGILDVAADNHGTLEASARTE